jgi:hypothetical protein
MLLTLLKITDWLVFTFYKMKLSFINFLLFEIMDFVISEIFFNYFLVCRLLQMNFFCPFLQLRYSLSEEGSWKSLKLSVFFNTFKAFESFCKFSIFHRLFSVWPLTLETKIETLYILDLTKIHKTVKICLGQNKKYESLYDKLNCQVSTIFMNPRSIHVETLREWLCLLPSLDLSFWMV